ncbi:hypothetical protein [Rhizobium sp. A37_96]
MTTTVVVKANHGWPVDVEGRDPKTGEKVQSYGGRVAAGETREFYCTSSMDLAIHEVQPDEIEQTATDTAE